MSAGTPKDLRQAVTVAAASCPMSQGFDEPTRILKDFLAQKFATAYIRVGQWREGSSTQYTPEEIVQNLWTEITGEVSK